MDWWKALDSEVDGKVFWPIVIVMLVVPHTAHDGDTIKRLTAS
jgi:hypothetical protein